MARMWEGVAAEGWYGEAVVWLRAQRDASAADRAEVFGDPEQGRLVLVTWWAGEVGADPTPPEALLQRAHGWSFTAL